MCFILPSSSSLPPPSLPPSLLLLLPSPLLLLPTPPLPSSPSIHPHHRCKHIAPSLSSPWIFKRSYFCTTPTRGSTAPHPPPSTHPLPLSLSPFLLSLPPTTLLSFSHPLLSHPLLPPLPLLFFLLFYRIQILRILTRRLLPRRHLLHSLHHTPHRLIDRLLYIVHHPLHVLHPSRYPFQLPHHIVRLPHILLQRRRTLHHLRHHLQRLGIAHHRRKLGVRLHKILHRGVRCHYRR